jgi:hypothetical protein
LRWTKMGWNNLFLLYFWPLGTLTCWRVDDCLFICRCVDVFWCAGDCVDVLVLMIVLMCWCVDDCVEMAHPVMKINIEQRSIRCFRRLINVEQIENIETSKWHIPNEDKHRTKIETNIETSKIMDPCCHYSATQSST